MAPPQEGICLFRTQRVLLGRVTGVTVGGLLQQPQSKKFFCGSQGQKDNLKFSKSKLEDDGKFSAFFMIV